MERGRSGSVPELELASNALDSSRAGLLVQGRPVRIGRWADAEVDSSVSDACFGIIGMLAMQHRLVIVRIEAVVNIGLRAAGLAEARLPGAVADPRGPAPGRHS